MNPWLILTLLAAVVAGVFLSRWLMPTGRHRAVAAPGPVTDLACCSCTRWPRLAPHTVRDGGRLACRSCGRIKEAA